MSSGPSVLQDTIPHTLNVAVHIAFGALALIAGLIPLLTRKGGRWHVQAGRWFLVALAMVIVTAVIGIAFFGFRAFLGVITLLSAYEAYSGYRALRIRFTGPDVYDALISVVALASAALFIGYIRSVHFPWSPAVIYPTLGALLVVAAYDLVRFAFPKRWFESTWFYEHLIKMLGAYSAVVSAFSGTVLARWQPYSQILPSVLAVAAMVGFLIHFRNGPPVGRPGSSRRSEEPLERARAGTA
jgi:hypothetical protein